MSKKINYNAKNKKNNLNLVIIIGIIIIVLIVIIASVKKLNSAANSTNNYAFVYKEISEYKTLEELISSYNCKVIDKEEYSSFVKVTVSFGVDLYTGDISNEDYFLNLCKAIAKFIHYKDFELLDTKKGIDIEVKCEKPNIIDFRINGDANYYLNANTQKYKDKNINITNFTIQSPELQELIDGNWDEKEVNWGTRESTYAGDNIYFDEGIRYNLVNRKVFRVIFTEKYQGQVAGGLTVNSTKSEIEKALGMPTLSEMSVYGYMGENNYLFFDFLNTQIVVYPVVRISEEEEVVLKQLIDEMNNSLDIKSFASKLTLYWPDYDVFEFDNDYVDLRYTLKGVQLFVSSDSLKNGIFIYQNYSGDRDITELENVYMEKMDFVLKNAATDSITEDATRCPQLSWEESMNNKESQSDYVVLFKSNLDGNYIGPIFCSKTKEYPDSELSHSLEISSYQWYGKNMFVYSVNGNGIYVYNCDTRKNVKIADIDEKIEIDNVSDEEIVYNNNAKISVEIEKPRTN